jgi:AcrR family transcriptional regulator
MSRLPAAKRREQLLETAASLFAQYGFAGATTAQIARAAGVTEPIIYRHFKSKRDLFVALIDRASDATIKLWEHEVRGVATPEARLIRLIRANPMVTSKGRDLYRVIVQAMTEVEDPLIKQSLVNHIDKLRSFIERVVGEAQKSGTVSTRFSPEITAWALIHMGLGYGILAAAGIPDHGVDKSGMHIQDLLGQLMLGEQYRRP